MVEGGSDQAHRPGHVPENLLPKKLDGTDGAVSQLAPSHRLVCRGHGARWRSPARRVLVILEVAFAESRPSTFSVDAVVVRGVEISSPFSLSDPFGYPAGSLEAGSFYPQYRPVSAKPHPCSPLVMRSPERLPFPKCRPSSEDDGSRRRSPCRPEPSRTGPEG